VRFGFPHGRVGDFVPPLFLLFVMRRVSYAPITAAGISFISP